MWLEGQWFSEDTVRRIASVVAGDPELTRTSLSRQVCEWLGWRGANGKLREVGCRKALLELERRKLIALPPVVVLPEFVEALKETECNESEPEPLVQEIRVRCELADLQGLEVVPISGRYSLDSRIWKELMQRNHYLGAGPLCGAQLKYLIRSKSHGLLGGLSFSAATKRLRERDVWIAWSESARRTNLEKVVCNSRYLIHPGVEVPNLASRVLRLAVTRLPGDWMARYGYEPLLLETFVDPKRFNGTCYRAANWHLLGRTAGREEGFKNGKVPDGPKDVYVYPLRQDVKKLLQQEVLTPLAVRGRSADAKDWADEEFGGAQVFEGRLRDRLCCLARDFFAQPGASIPLACGGSEAKTKAAYRFFGNERLDMKLLLRGHTEATLARSQEHKTVLAVQDTTTVNYTAHGSTRGLGPINTTKDNGTGLVLHSTIGVTLDGTPLGILNAQCWARDPEEAGKSKERSGLDIEEKESVKWLRSFRAVAEAQRLCPNTVFVSTGDREADIHEVFLEAKKTEGGPKLLIRANKARERRVGDTSTATEYEYLWARLLEEPVSGTVELQIPRQKERPARKATLEIRFAKLSLAPPKSKPNLDAVEVWAVHAREVGHEPTVKEPVDWLVLTTVEVRNFDEAVERIRWYALRWNIEVFHRVLKTGTRVEDRQLGDAESIQNCLAVDMVVAWRIQWLTKLGRETPAMPCDVFFTEEEWKVLHVMVKHSSPPTTPPSLRDAVRMVARLGGFLGRKHDGEPGTETMWRGLVRLAAMVEGYREGFKAGQATEGGDNNERDGP